MKWILQGLIHSNTVGFFFFEILVNVDCTGKVSQILPPKCLSFVSYLMSKICQTEESVN